MEMNHEQQNRPALRRLPESRSIPQELVQTTVRTYRQGLSQTQHMNGPAVANRFLQML
jgi:hypothetical protein